MESFVAFACTVFKCITNKQTDKQTDILLYIYRYIHLMLVGIVHHMYWIFSYSLIYVILCVWYIPFVLYLLSYVFGIFRFFDTRHPMCPVYSFCSVPIIICVWHIQFVLYASSYVFRLFLSFFSSTLKFLVPNGKKRKF